MNRSGLRRTVSATIATLVVAVGGTLAVAPAHADADGDKAFIAYLDRKDFPYKDRTQIIRMAKQFCLDQTRQGKATWVATYDLQVAEGWTGTQAQNFIGGAIPVYCPQLWK